MLKKRNIAMVMAAATVATSVAPVFASSIDVQKVDEAKMIADVQQLLNTKYTNQKDNGLGGIVQAGQEYTNSVYSIVSNIALADGTSVIKSVADVKEVIEKSKLTATDLTLQVTDKGHAEVDGNIVSTENTKYRQYSATFADADVNGVSTNDLVDGKLLLGVNPAVSITGGEATIDLPSGQKLDLVVGDYVLDLTKPIDANGNLIDQSTADAATLRKVVGFKYAEDTTSTIKDIPSKRVSDLKITSKIEVVENLSDLVTEEGYTQKGADLVNLLVKAKTAGSTIVKDGVKLYLGTFVAGDMSAITSTKDGYEMTIQIEVRDKAIVASSKNIDIVIKSTSQADLTDLKTKITNASSTVVAGNFTKLAGENRFETAVEVSKEAYPEKNADPAVDARTKASAVVLVGEDAIVDGLASAPLAAQKNAPILLTKSGEVPAETMNEIKRIVAKGADVYLIGGENTISKDVEQQLISEMNANLTRLDGNDRFETSIAIAEELGNAATKINTKAYVVGGTGLADAMSIASLAAKDGVTGGDYTVSPIIVTPKEGLTKDAKNYLKTNKVINNVEVVGGESHASLQVLKDIDGIENTATGAGVTLTVSRTAGTDRNETNARVIKAIGANSVENVYVAKDGDTQLIDALAAAPLAGRNDGVIVLATNDLTKSQQDAINTVKSTATPNTKTLTQVGNGIAGTLVQKLAGLLGL